MIKKITASVVALLLTANMANAQIHTVKKGDTLWSIAKKYKTTVDKIANVNNIVDENKIDIGQKILIIR